MEVDKLDLISVGMEATIEHKITLQDVDTFFQLTGDDNPLHMDEQYAASTSFRTRVVHGMLTASFISTMIGTKLPGKGSLWFEQHLRFMAPVRIGDTIKVWAKVKHKSVVQRIVVLETIVFDGFGRIVIDGEAKVKVLATEQGRWRQDLSSNKGAIIVSGGGKGIGAAIAKELASDGFPVVVNYLSSRERAEKLAAEISDTGGKIIIQRADVTDPIAVQIMIDNAIQQFGTIYGIVNNASAPTKPLGFEELSWETFQDCFDVQLKGAYNLVHAAIPHFIAQKKGVVVNIGSVYTDNVPPAKMMPYCMSKAALTAFSKSLAVEYGNIGIRVNCVSPGMTQTDFIADVPEKAKMLTKMQTPLRALTEPEEIAGVVSFLFSDKATMLTGQNIRVCGGIVMS